MLAVDGFIEHVGVIAAETDEFLLEPYAGLGHHFFVATVPQFIPMGESSRDAAAGCFNDMFADCIGVERRKFAVPVNSLCRFGRHLG